MVKLYLTEGTKNLQEDEKGRYLDIKLISLIKAYFISGLIITAIIYVIFFILGLTLGF